MGSSCSAVAPLNPREGLATALDTAGHASWEEDSDIEDPATPQLVSSLEWAHPPTCSPATSEESIRSLRGAHCTISPSRVKFEVDELAVCSPATSSRLLDTPPKPEHRRSSTLTFKLRRSQSREACYIAPPPLHLPENLNRTARRPPHGLN